MTLEELASSFGTHDYIIEKWVNNLQITQDEIVFALANLDKRQRFNLMLQKLRPAPYLLEHPELIAQIQTVDVEKIKALPEDVYLTHFKQLQEADKIDDEVNKRQFPYSSYDAQVFCTLRHVKSKSDIKFIKGMFARRISHHSYPKARQKLSALALKFAA